MRIGLLTHSVNPRGGVVHTLELAEALRQAGHHVTVLATARPGQRFFRPVACATELVALPPADAPVPAAGMVREIGTRIAAIERHLDATLDARLFDILHAQDPIGANALANLRARGRIGAFVRTVHHLDHFDEPQLAAWQERGFRAADAVLCVSPTWQRHLRATYGIDSGLVVNGVDTRRYAAAPQPGDAALRARLGLRADAPVVLCVGGVEERKNTQRLLQAFVVLRAVRPALQLVIAGGASLLDHSGYARGFQALMDEHGLQAGPGAPVVLTGPLPDADMPALFRLAAVTAMPSVREGFGLVVLESLASGTPVVVSRIAPFTEYLAEGDVAWADPLDPASIARALAQALDGHDPRRVAASAARLASHFHWGASARQHLGHYAALRARSAAAVPA